MMIITTVSDLRTWASRLLGPDQSEQQTENLVEAARTHGPDWGTDWEDWFEALDTDTLCDWADGDF